MSSTIPNVENIIKRGVSATSAVDPLIAAVTKGLVSMYPLKRARFHAKVSGYCERQAVLFTQIPEDYMGTMNAAGALYVAVGTGMHEAIQKALQQSGIMLANEFRINELGLNLGGLVDGIINLDGVPTILEIKSNGSPVGRIKDDHRAQALTYCLATGLRDAVVLYASRKVAEFSGKLLMQDFKFTATDDELENVAIKLARSYFYSLGKVIPHIPIGFDGPHMCTWCPFKEFCWEGTPLPVPEVAAAQEVELEKSVKTVVKRLLGGMNDRREATLKAIGFEEKKDGTTALPN